MNIQSTQPPVSFEQAVEEASQISERLSELLNIIQDGGSVQAEDLAVQPATPSAKDLWELVQGLNR